MTTQIMGDDFFKEIIKRSKRARQIRPNVSSEDLLFSISGPEQVQTIGELNSSGETLVFGCMRVSDAYPELVVPDSVMKNCRRCAATVWMSPATLITYERIEKGEIVCMRCLGLNV